jgi:hypothetical protein
MSKSIYFEQPGEEEKVKEFYDRLMAGGKEHMVERYNDQVKIGFVGVRAQVRFMIALNRAFLEVFGRSPVEVNGPVVGMTGEIFLQGDNFFYCPVDNN